MWWKLTALAVVEVVLVWWLVTGRSIPTHAVIYDPSKPPPPESLPVMMLIGAYAVMIAVVLIPVLAYWIYRHASQP